MDGGEEKYKKELANCDKSDSSGNTESCILKYGKKLRKRCENFSGASPTK